MLSGSFVRIQIEVQMFSAAHCLMKLGFRIIVGVVHISPIVHKNLQAIGAILWKPLDCLDRPKRAFMLVKGHESDNILLARNSFKMAAMIRRENLAAIGLNNYVFAFTRQRNEKYQESTDLGYRNFLRKEKSLECTAYPCKNFLFMIENRLF